MPLSRWHGPSRFAVYAAVVLVPVLALGAVLTVTGTREADRAALAAGVLQARGLAQAVVQTQLEGHPLADGLTAHERHGITALAAPLLESGTALRFRLRDTRGRVMFDAADPDAPPGPDLPDDEVAEAIEDGSVAVLTEIGRDAVDGGATGGAPAIEVYLPVASRSGAVVGALEIYIPYAPIARARAISIERMYLAIGVGLLSVWLVLAGIVWSVSRRIHRQSERARHLALHDPLTGLPNRTLFVQRAGVCLATARRLGRQVTVAVIDLDRFQDINDTLGIEAGDAFLRRLADRLRREVRVGDTVARLGGDEFGLVLPGVSGPAAERLLDRLRTAISTDVELGGTPVAVEFTIGRVSWPASSGTAENLLRRAGIALAAARADGVPQLEYHDGLVVDRGSRLGMVAQLRRAIDDGELRVHFQPKVDVATRRPVGLEALVRWEHPTRGLLPPDEFVPVAESTGLIGPLTRWVVTEVLDQLVRWRAADPVTAVLSVSVNISARNLRDAELAGWLVAGLDQRGLARDRLVVEITETAAIGDHAGAARQIGALRAAGVTVSLDDFGQGYTSLSQLATMPVREIKIDRAFVAAIGSSGKDRAIVASVIGLGHALGLQVVAEGVESDAVLRELTALGCDVAQGYLFARPMPPEAVPAYVAASRASSGAASRADVLV